MESTAGFFSADAAVSNDRWPFFGGILGLFPRNRKDIARS